MYRCQWTHLAAFICVFGISALRVTPRTQKSVPYNPTGSPQIAESPPPNVCSPLPLALLYPAPKRQHFTEHSLRPEFAFAHVFSLVLEFRSLHTHHITAAMLSCTLSVQNLYRAIMLINWALPVQSTRQTPGCMPVRSSAATKVSATTAHIVSYRCTPYLLTAASIFYFLVLYAQLLSLALAYAMSWSAPRPHTPPPGNGAIRSVPSGPVIPPDPTYDTLTFSALNVGGVKKTPYRFGNLLAGFDKLPHSLSISEFRPSSASRIREHERISRYWKYQLLASSLCGRNRYAFVPLFLKRKTEK